MSRPSEAQGLARCPGTEHAAAGAQKSKDKEYAKLKLEEEKLKVDVPMTKDLVSSSAALWC